MNKEVQHVVQTIVESKGPVKWLELTDQYIIMYNRMKGAFVLSGAHSHLSVLVETYHNDVEGFRDLVKYVRDLLDGAEKVEVHGFYRKLLMRVSAAKRRERVNTAADLIQDHLGIKFTSGQRDAVMAWLQQYWDKARVDFLNLHRSAAPGKRLTTDQRSDLSIEFWESIETSLKNNIVPIPPEVVYAKLAPLE